VPFDADAGRARFLEAMTAARPAARTRRVAPWALAAAAVLCVAAFVAVLRAPRALTFTAGGGRGETGAWLSTSGGEPLPITFSEGTRVVLAAGSRGRVEETSRAGAVVLLERGEVSANVVHRASTAWRFRAGPFDVDVTGTVLDVAWDPDKERLTVRVDSGSVVVHGPNVGMQVVSAAQRCVVDMPTRHVELLPADATPPQEQAPTAPRPPGSADDEEDTRGLPSASGPGSPAAALPSWTALERRGDVEGAYAAARGAGLSAVIATASADDLVRLAQVSAVTGHADTARDALLACRRRYAGTPQAALSAYELGRASSGAEAARWFQTYLGEAPSGPLAREAMGRLLEADVGAGNKAAARDTAARYLARYPSGPHAALARRILASSP
jgi:hypothetical protein